MGLLDSIGFGNQGGYGGLLDMLMQPSPLTQPQAAPQPQYDAMGNYTGVTPQSASDPFGPPPQLAEWAKQFAPQSASAAPSPFTGGAPAAPVQFSAGPTMQPPAPQQPAPQAAPPQMSADGGQVNDASVGGYSMPRMGSVAEYTPDPAAIPQNAQPTQGYLPQYNGKPQMQQQEPSTLPRFLSNEGGLGAGLRGIVDNLHTGPIGAIAGGLGSALGMQNPAQQNLKAQYDALVPLVGPQKAMLAVMNPEAGKTILAQALEKKQYGFTKLDNDTIVNQDPQTGKVSVAYSADKGSTIQGPDGKMITMPEGADPKTWRNEITRINADVAAGKKTEVQAKSEIFANKMESSNKSLDSLASQGTSLAGKIASGLPMGNYIQSPEYQKYKQAASNFITALLRQESGAAISKSEFDRYDKEYMPQPGDGPDVLAQKTDARRIAIEGMKKGAGPGYKSPSESPASLPSGWSVKVR